DPSRHAADLRGQGGRILRPARHRPPPGLGCARGEGCGAAEGGGPPRVRPRRGGDARAPRGRRRFRGGAGRVRAERGPRRRRHPADLPRARPRTGGAERLPPGRRRSGRPAFRDGGGHDLSVLHDRRPPERDRGRTPERGGGPGDSGGHHPARHPAGPGGAARSPRSTAGPGVPGGAEASGDGDRRRGGEICQLEGAIDAPRGPGGRGFSFWRLSGNMSNASSSVSGAAFDLMKPIAPHGGVLVDRVLTGRAREEALREARALPRIVLHDFEVSDVEMIASGALSPLTGFLGQQDFASVLESARLANGLVWSIPILLARPAAVAEKLRPGSSVALALPAQESSGGGGDESLLAIL